MRFSEIVGHAHVKDLLLRAGARGRIPHAYLFHGPEGVGKRSTALAFLSWLVCRDRTADDSCGRCGPCRQVHDGTFVDLQVLAPEKGNIKIDPLREALPRLYFEPLIGPWKCLLIDDAHAMLDVTANAALKTIEEPPGNTFFVLVTPTPDILPRTVLSRCFGVPFGPLHAEEVAAFLRARGVADADARAAAARARGSPGTALRLLESPVLAERVPFVTAFLDLADAGPEARLRLAEDVAKNRDELEDILDLLESVIQDVVLAVGGAPDTAFANADLAGPIRACAARLGPDRALGLAQAFLDWDATRRYNPNARMALDRLVLSM